MIWVVFWVSINFVATGPNAGSLTAKDVTYIEQRDTFRLNFWYSDKAHEFYQRGIELSDKLNLCCFELDSIPYFFNEAVVKQ